MSQKDAQIINQYITRLLARREQSRAELLQKLSVKGFDENLCQTQLMLFTQRDIQSDERFCESFVRSQYAKGKGPSVIKQRLKQHDIDESFVNEVLRDEQFDWYSLALNVREKKFGLSAPADFMDKQKQMRFLQYRGFTQEHINEAFNS